MSDNKNTWQDELDTLLNRLVDEELAAEDQARLNEILHEQPEAREQYHQYLDVHEGLQANLAMPDFSSLDTVLTPEPATNVVEPVPTGTFSRALLAMAALIVIGLFINFLVQEPAQPPVTEKRAEVEPIAKVRGLSGLLVFTGDRGIVRNDLNVGDQLVGGTIEGMTPAAWFELEFKDGSVVMISGNSILTFSDDGQKKLRLKEGGFSANVKPQPKGKPLLVSTRTALFEVMGTRFNVDVDPTTSTLTVSEGRVLATRLSDNRSVEVPAKHRVVASQDRELSPVRLPDSVDWETMITKMDGFGGLYKHSQKTIIKRIIDTYKDDAVDSWPKFAPPAAPHGSAAKAKITWWELGKRYESSFHDLELGPNGLAYAVNISKHYLVTLDTRTDKQVYKKFPRGSYGPHSIEPDNDGHMWVTMCASGQMAKYDIHKKEFEIYSSAEAPARRGGYPHTLRVNPQDPEGLVWYTDAGRNSVFSLHPKTKKVKEYHLLSANQAIAAGKGESRGITPYGLDFSPVDGMIWYSKLNGNRIGRIDPNAPDGDIKEWNPPFRGPRRLHIAPDGMIWVPGFASGVFAKFHPKTEKWTVYDLPNKDNQIPYALNVAPNGHVWICGTHNDSLLRFNPDTEYLVAYRLPNRVSYTREIEFDADGNVWTSTSGPSRHMETGFGAIIKLEPKDLSDTGGVKLKGYMPDRSKLTYEQPRPINYNGPNAKLLARIDETQVPQAYFNSKHQPYVDARMKTLTNNQKHRINILWQEKRRADPDMPMPGHFFVRIMEHVAKNEK